MNNKEMAQKLKELRGSRTLEEVASAVGITAAALSHYEQGIRVPRDSIKIRLAKYYKRSVQHIFFTGGTCETRVNDNEH